MRAEERKGHQERRKRERNKIGHCVAVRGRDEKHEDSVETAPTYSETKTITTAKHQAGERGISCCLPTLPNEQAAATVAVCAVLVGEKN